MQSENCLKCSAYFYFQEITDYHEELDAHREIVKMIDDQIILHESYQKEAPPQNRAMWVVICEILFCRILLFVAHKK